MTSRRIAVRLTSVLLSTGLLQALAIGQDAAPESLPPGIEVLQRGPVHEAFAEVIVFEPRLGPTVGTPPAEPIREVPPAERPEGLDVAWIPGYWAWDADESRYLWISGVWRQIPPGRQWVPGYWHAVPDGHQWVAGFWSSVPSEAITYLPTPPASLEAGPTSPAPSGDFAWVPGCWIWQPADQAYAWQPGYWQVVVSDWVWVPAHYGLTPAGAVFISGYRDYCLAKRGCLYAPVCFAEPVYAAPTFVFCPSYQVEVTQIVSCLYVQQSTCHYYYGDYGGDAYVRRGYVPCHQYSASRRGYDPISGYNDWRGGQRQRAWNQQVVREFQRYATNSGPRVPRIVASPRGLAQSSSTATLRTTSREIVRGLQRGGGPNPVNPVPQVRRIQRQVEQLSLSPKPWVENPIPRVPASTVRARQERQFNPSNSGRSRQQFDRPPRRQQEPTDRGSRGSSGNRQQRRHGSP